MDRFVILAVESAAAPGLEQKHKPHWKGASSLFLSSDGGFAGGSSDGAHRSS